MFESVIDHMHWRSPSLYPIHQRLENQMDPVDVQEVEFAMFLDDEFSELVYDAVCPDV